MSVRVRCRCGQELHLRYGEWVYAFLGLVVLCLALNSVGLLLILFHLEEIAVRMESSAGGESATAASSSPTTPGAGGREPAGSQRAAGRKRRAAKDAPSTKVDGAASPTGAPSTEEKRASRDEPPRAAPPGSPRESAGAAEPLDDRPAEDGPARLADGHPDSGDPSPAPDGGTAAPATTVAPPSPAPTSLFADEAPLVRLLLLEQAPGGLDWRLGFLLDEDRRLRRRALERLRSYRARVTAKEETFESPRAREWLRVVRGSLEAGPDGQAALGELAALFPYASAGSAPGGTSLPELIAATSATGVTFLEQPAARSVVESARGIAASGLDCVLLLDVSQSMEDVLGAARREIARLWLILSWGLPGLRLGVVLYRDEVAGVLDFATAIDEQLARLEEVEASGGGNVPESLHLAIGHALRLGVFDWRPDALKHIVVLGDAPPPYVEQPGLASLVRRARQQAGFRVHTLGFNPEEGRESVPFFADLARAGGGRTVTIDPASVANEVLRCLQPGASLELLEPLLAVADRLLSSR